MRHWSKKGARAWLKLPRLVGLKTLGCAAPEFNGLLIFAVIMSTMVGSSVLM